MVLKKTTALYDRDENDKLLPVEVELEIDEMDELQLEYKDEKIKVIPMPRGKIKRIFSEVSSSKDDEKDFDGEIIGDHCFDPKFEKEEIPHIKPALATIIVNTIFRESGLKTGKSKANTIDFIKRKGLHAEYLKYVKDKQLNDAEDDFAKN